MIIDFRACPMLSHGLKKASARGSMTFFLELIFAKLCVILQHHSNVRTIDIDCSLIAAQTEPMIDRGRTYPPIRSQLAGSLAKPQIFMIVISTNQKTGQCPKVRTTHGIIEVREISQPDPSVRLGGDDGLGPYRLARVILRSFGPVQKGKKTTWDKFSVVDTKVIAVITRYTVLHFT